jgi:hypothetical protein
MDAHALAEERSLELHREIVRRLQQDQHLIERARARVRGWLVDGSVSPHYAQQWAALLEGPFDALRAMLVDEGERARALRQCTPFAGVVDPRTRWRIWREVRQRVEALR